MMKHIIENCTILDKTENAIRIESPNLKKTIWIIKDGIHSNSEIKGKNQTGNLRITDYLAEVLGII